MPEFIEIRGYHLPLHGAITILALNRAYIANRCHVSILQWIKIQLNVTKLLTKSRYPDLLDAAFLMILLAINSTG